MDNRVFFVTFVLTHLMTCLGFGMGLYIYTIMDRRLTQAETNIVNYSAPLDDSIASFGLEMQKGLAGLSSQMTLLQKNLTSILKG